MLNSVVEYLKKSCLYYGNNLAIIDRNKEYTYSDLNLSAKRVASWICTTIKEEKRPIIVFMENSAEAIMSFWGVAYSNNIYVPLDIKLPIDRKRKIIEILNPAGIIICNGKQSDVLLEECARWTSCPAILWEEIIGYPVDDAIAEERAKKIIDVNPLYIVFTSGSTGVPKGVTISHRAVIDFTEEASEIMHFCSEDRFLNQAPFYFDASVPDLYCSVRNGAQLHIVPRSNYAFPKKLAEYIYEKKITHLYWVPSALVTMANLKALDAAKMASLKKVMFCGEVMPVKQLNEWIEVLPNVTYVNYYGPSETTYASSYYIVDRRFDDSEVLPIGKAANNTELLILSDKGEVVKSPGIIGELYIRGSGLSLGYYNNPEKTKEVFICNPAEENYKDIIYKTGDLAHFDEKGFIYFDGRADHQIKHMGYRIELGEIECAFSSGEGVDRVACVYDDERDMIVSFYEGTVDVKGIIQYISSQLPAYMIPGKVIRLDRLPFNSNDKIDRLELMQRFKEGAYEND